MWTVSHHCHVRTTTLLKAKRNGPGHIVLFPSSSFDSNDSTSFFFHGFDRCHDGRKWRGKEVGDSINANNIVVHMVNRRAYARGIRTHFVSQSALATLLLGVSTVE